jgi:WD40 repeat protein
MCRSSVAAPQADPDTLLRRLTLDLAGRIPTIAERDGFLALPEEQRARLIVDRLMELTDFEFHLRNSLHELLLDRHLADGAMIADWGDYPLKTGHGYPSMLFAVTFSADGSLLATGNKTGHVLIRSLPSGEIVGRQEAVVMYTWDPTARQHSIGGIRSVAFSSDASLVAVGGTGRIGNVDHLEAGARIEVFRRESGERLYEIEDTKYKGLVESLRFARNDMCLIAAGGDHSGFVSVWNAADGKLLAQEKTGNHIHDCTLNADETTIIAVGHEQGAIVKLE